MSERHGFVRFGPGHWTVFDDDGNVVAEGVPCPECGYLRDHEDDDCPRCGEETPAQP